MKYIKMSFEQVQRMTSRQDGYDDFNEWLKDIPVEDRDSIHDLVEVFDIVNVDGAKGYTFEDDKGRWCIWIKY